MAYSYKRTITIDHTKVGGTLINFPILFSITDSTFKTVGNGGHVQNSSGYDINFFSDSSGTSLLTWEQEFYDATTGNYIAWIKIPSLSSSVDTVIYVFYGDPTISTSQTTPTGVWDSNYKGVWHLPNGTSLTANDSTSNGFNGTINNISATSGLIDGCGNWSGVANDQINVGNIPLDSNNWTVSTWIYMPNVTTYYTRIVSYHGNGPTIWKAIGNGNLAIVHGGTIDLAGDTAVTNNTWHYLVITRAGSTAAFYNNGVNTSLNTSFSATYTASDSAIIGNSAIYNEPVTGKLDEVRISNIARSGSWILTEYNNQSSPFTFYSLGSENPVTVGSDNNRRLLLKV